MPMLLVLTLILGSMLIFFLAVYRKLNSLKPVVEVKQTVTPSSFVRDVYDQDLISVENGIDILKNQFLRLGFDSERTTDWRHIVNAVLPINSFIDSLLKSGYSNPEILAFNSSKEKVGAQIAIFTLDKVIKSDMTGRNVTHKVGFICPIQKIQTRELKVKFQDEHVWGCISNILVIIPGSKQIEESPHYIRDHIKYSEIETSIMNSSVEWENITKFNPYYNVLTYSPRDGGKFRSTKDSVTELRFSIDEIKTNYSTIEINYGDQVKFTDDLTKIIALIRASVMEGRSVMFTDSDSIVSGGTGKTSLMKILAKQFALDPNLEVTFIKGVPNEGVSLIPEVIEQSVYKIRQTRYEADNYVQELREQKNVLIMIDQAENILNPVHMPTIMAALENHTDVNISFILSYNRSPIVAIPKPMLRQGRSITFKFGYLENPSVLDLITKLSKLDIVQNKHYYIDGALAEKYINGEVKCTLNDVFALLKSRDMSVLDETINEL